MEAELGEVGAEPRVRSGNAEVRRAGEPETASDGCSLHRRDDGQRRLEQPDRLGVQLPWSTAGAAIAAEVGARAEVLALRAEHDDPGVSVASEMRVEVCDPPDHRQVEEVVGRATELHGRDTVFDGRAHTVLLLEHLPTLSRRCGAVAQLPAVPVRRVLTVPSCWPAVNMCTTSKRSSRRAVVWVSLATVPLRKNSPLLEVLGWVSVRCSSGTRCPSIIAVRTLSPVLSTKSVAETVLPACVKLSPPLCEMVPVRPGMVTSPT